jgi:hypothetical protein
MFDARGALPTLALFTTMLSPFIYEWWRLERERLPDPLMILGGAVVVWLVARLVVRVWTGARLGRHRARVEALGALAASLHDGKVDMLGFYGDGAAVVRGVRRGRRVRLSLQRDRVVLEAWVVHPVATLDLTRPTLPERLTRTLSRRPGETWRAVRREGRTDALERVEVERALERLFRDHAVERLTLREGALRAERPLRDGDLDAERLDEAFALLAEVAGPFERRELVVQALARAGRVTCFGWTGGGAGLRCPYCRDDLDPEAPGLAACERCRTLHHAPCYEEAAGCTVFGCAGAKDSARHRRVQT